MKTLKVAGLAAGGIAAVMMIAGVLDGKKRQKMDPEDIFPSPLEENARARVVDTAKGEIGQQNPEKYWKDVLSPDIYNEAQIEQYSGSRDWCGGFALWCIKQAGLAPDIYWVDGKGFCYQLPRTNEPKPGDVAYFDKPYQHHAIVAEVKDSDLITVDGNQRGDTVAMRIRKLSDATAFYSIEKLVSNALA